MGKIKDIMSTKIFALRDDDSLNFARFLMDAQHIRHIPIVDEDHKFLGLLTHRDLLNLSISSLAGISPKSQAELHVKIPLNRVMKRDVKTITPETDIKDAARMMIDHKWGCLPVLTDGKLVGIVTEADFVKMVHDLLQFVDGKIKKGEI